MLIGALRPCRLAELHFENFRISRLAELEPKTRMGFLAELEPLQDNPAPWRTAPEGAPSGSRDAPVWITPGRAPSGKSSARGQGRSAPINIILNQFKLI